MSRWIVLLLLVGCTKETTLQTIGAVCNRGQGLAAKAHAERVAVVTAIKELRKQEGPEVAAALERTAERCRATQHYDVATQEVYAVILDAQVVTTSRWGPVSEAIQKMVRTPGIEHCDAIPKKDPDAFKNVRAWAEQMQKAHGAAYDACRALTK